MEIKKKKKLNIIISMNSNSQKRKRWVKGMEMRSVPEGKVTATCHEDRCSVKIIKADWEDWKKNRAERGNDSRLGREKLLWHSNCGETYSGGKQSLTIRMLLKSWSYRMSAAAWVEKVSLKQRLRKNSCCAMWCPWPGLKRPTLRWEDCFVFCPVCLTDAQERVVNDKQKKRKRKNLNL